MACMFIIMMVLIGSCIQSSGVRFDVTIAQSIDVDADGEGDVEYAQKIAVNNTQNVVDAQKIADALRVDVDDAHQVDVNDTQKVADAQRVDVNDFQEDGDLRPVAGVDDEDCDPSATTCFTIKNMANVPVSIVALKSRIVPKLIQGSTLTQAVLPKIKNRMQPDQEFTFKAETDFPGKWNFKIIVDDGPGEFEWSLNRQAGTIVLSAGTQETVRQTIKYLGLTDAAALAAAAKGASIGATLGPIGASVGFVGGYYAGKSGAEQGAAAITTIAINAYENRNPTNATVGVQHRRDQLKKWKKNKNEHLSFYDEVLRDSQRGAEVFNTEWWNALVDPKMVAKDALKYWKAVDKIYRYGGAQKIHTWVWPKKRGTKFFAITGGFKQNKDNAAFLEWTNLECTIRTAEDDTDINSDDLREVALDPRGVNNQGVGTMFDLSEAHEIEDAPYLQEEDLDPVVAADWADLEHAE